MTPLPAALGKDSGLVVWRLDQRIHAATWDSGEGAFRAGGRWNSKGVRAVYSDDAPNANWLQPGIPSAGQQAFGDDLLRRHRFVAIPSTVSIHSWNLIFDPLKAAGFYSVESQEPFALDTRLHPPA
jgi:RES domain-containing protein